ncbi:MAG TPA: CRISPR-associated helicase/endonuclease Cas3 [Clostridiales bacterium]|nr:CRISPR-associated helicase Cas3' [Clostridiales bacterium]HBL82535.1 CRISPR-associated helicase/endonuclease Cas3 [Clostridiales bacterium]
MFYAHINGNTEEKQLLKDHLQHTAEYAQKNLAVLNLGECGYLCGILHDMGKYKKEFQEYLKRASNGEQVVRGSVNHTFCGVIYLLENFHETSDIYGKLFCEIAAFAIGAHHGLFDCYDREHKRDFMHRLQKDKAEIGYQECIDAYFYDCLKKEELEGCFFKATKQLKQFMKQQQKHIEKTAFCFMTGMLSRLVLSALIDADRRDTAEFMGGFRCAEFDVQNIWKREQLFYEEKIAKLQQNSQINVARAEFSLQSKRFSETHGNGIYRLNIPTGGGKTLASMRFAISHCLHNKKSKIFFIIPLLSVLEQNATVIREYMYDSRLVTEHHSNIVTEKFTEEELQQYELVCERWEAPVILTTLVQLLNAMFDGGTASVRRFHSLADSVIVIDEVQSIPAKMLYMFNMAVNFLSEFCGACVLLCSATQPCFEELKYPLNFSPCADVIPYQESLFRTFKRNDIINAERKGGYTLEETAEFARRLLNEGSLLIICNKKMQAEALYRMLQDSKASEIFHLSTSMCMKHRQNTLTKICAALDEKKPVLCVSTQLVEAGIDFSFDNVIRFEAGIDNIVQAAGRCNRNGAYTSSHKVYVINIKNELLRNLSDIETAKHATQQVLYSFERDRQRFSNNLSSEASVQLYYKTLYGFDDLKKRFVYPAPEYHSNLLDMLSFNNTMINDRKCSFLLRQSFFTAGKYFKVFDDNATDVIVPYDGSAKAIISALRERSAQYDLALMKKLLNRAKPYTVSLFEYQLKELEKNGGIALEEDRQIITLNPNFYDENTGVVTCAENIF